MLKNRLDLLLVERGLVESRSKAQALIMAGQVLVDGQMIDKAGTSFPDTVEISVVSGPRYVSRGGDKLEAALDAFPTMIKGRICADVGASTGGFTDCLLQHGAQKVYAIDVGKGILHWKLRTDPRVVVMEETNARFVEKLPEPVELVVIDASFITLKILLPAVLGWFVSEATSTPSGDVIALIKPQFEAGRKETARNKGVIRDPIVHKKVLQDVISYAQSMGFALCGLLKSPVLGPKGNVEFLAWLKLGSTKVEDPSRSIDLALGEGFDE